MILVVFVACACSVVTGDGDAGAARQIVFAACPAIVACVTHGIHVTTALFFFCFACKSFIACFVINPMLVAVDLGHEFAQSA